MRSAAGAAQTARQQSYDCLVVLRNFRTHADSAQPRNPTLNTRPSFRAGAREGLGTRLIIHVQVPSFQGVAATVPLEGKIVSATLNILVIW